MTSTSGVRALGAYSGPYQFKVQPHDGRTFQTAIQLDPFVYRYMDQMSPQVFPQADTLYFWFKTHTLTSGKPQSLSFITNSHPGLALRFEIYDKAKVDAQQGGLIAQSTCRTSQNEFAVPGAGLPSLPAQGADYYLVATTRVHFRLESFPHPVDDESVSNAARLAPHC